MNFSQIRPAIKITMLLTLILVSALAWAAEEKALGAGPAGGVRFCFCR